MFSALPTLIASLAPPATDANTARSEFPFELFRRARLARGARCPRCNSPEVSRWGGYAGRRRYRCGVCRRTFSDFTGTPLAYLKKIDRWPAHCSSAESVESIRREAARLGIHRNTAFRWRHRLLRALERSDRSELVGTVMLRDTSFHFSEKGSRRLQRPPRKRCWSFGWQSFAAPSVCVMFARSHSGRVATTIAEGRRPKIQDYARMLGDRLGNDARLASDYGSISPAESFARRVGHPHDAARLWKADREEASQYVVRLRRWMRRFHGVATKYLQNYLAWHGFLAAMGPADRGVGSWRLLMLRS